MKENAIYSFIFFLRSYLFWAAITQLLCVYTVSVIGGANELMELFFWKWILERKKKSFSQIFYIYKSKWNWLINNLIIAKKGKNILSVYALHNNLLNHYFSK